MNRIGCDVDGVLADYVSPYKDTIKKLSGLDMFPQSTEWSSWNYDKECGYTVEQSKAARESLWATEGFWEHLQPYPETTEVIMQLYGRIIVGDDVYFITDRTSTTEVSAKHQTERWLMNQTVGHLSIWADFYPTVLVTADKAPVAKALNLTHFIDDKWENCLAVKLECPDTNVYLLDRPWNRLGDNLFGVIRIGSVLDMLKEIN